MADYGLKISKAGYDVKTATDKDFIFTSKYTAFKIFAEYTGTITFVTDGTTAEGSTTITHDLGYKPAFLIMLGTASALDQLPFNRTSSAVYWGFSTTSIVRLGGFIVSATNVTFNYKIVVYIEDVPV